MKLLITDALHPAIAPMVTLLHRWCRQAQVGGTTIDFDIGQPAPPGVGWIDGACSPESGHYIEALLTSLYDAGADTLLPWTNRAVRAVAEHHDEFLEPNIALICPPPPLVALACDRWQTLQRLHQLNIPAPDARLVHTGSDLATAAGELGFPGSDLVVAPVDLCDTAIWTVTGDDYLSTRLTPHVSLATMSRILNAHARDADYTGVVVRRAIRDDGLSIDLLADQGTVLGAVARTRDNVPTMPWMHGTVGPLDPSTAELTTAFVRALDWSGPATVRIARTLRHGPLVYEIHPRLSHAISAATYTGMDLLTAAIRHAQGDPVNLAQRPTLTHVHRYFTDQHWPDRTQASNDEIANAEPNLHRAAPPVNAAQLNAIHSSERTTRR